MNYKLKVQTILPANPPESWSFFSDPRNLEKITPPEMAICIVTDNLPGHIYEGMLIRYTMAPMTGIRMGWTTEILDVKQPYCFTDIQREGPYTLWKHVHRFLPHAEGTIMEDLITYRLPLGPIGQLAHGLFVKKKLNNIFEYRASAIQKLFAGVTNTSP